MTSKKLLRRLALIAMSGLAASALAAGAAEVILRLAGVSFAGQAIFRVDADTGWSHHSNVSGRWTDEGPSWVQINSHGLRDREHAPRKPPATFRIVVLGDSFTAAPAVALEESYPFRLQQDFNKCPAMSGREVETINLGVMGFGTLQEYLALEKTGWTYDPDLVLLGFYPGNDVQDNSPELATTLRDLRPFLTADGRAIDRVFLQSADYRRRSAWPGSWYQVIKAHSRVVQLIAQTRRRGIQAFEGRRTDDSNRPESFAPPRTVAWEAAWLNTERALMMIAQTAKRHNAGFVIATLSDGVQVNPDPGADKPLRDRLGVRDLFYPERRLQDFGRAHEIPIIALAPALSRVAQVHHVFLHGFANTRMGEGHWNAAGHQQAARLIAQQLCEHLTRD